MREKKNEIITELSNIKDSDHMRRILEFIKFLEEKEAED